MKRTVPNQRGFTILELLIATTVFSVILLLVTVGIIQIGRNYYRGITQARTQETARAIIDEISRGIQFSGEKVVTTTPIGAYPTPGGVYAFCINGIGYSYVLDKQLTNAPSSGDHVDKALIAYTATCDGFSVPGSPPSGKELLAFGMRLTDLEVTNIPGTDSYNITVGIGTGEFDLFTPNPARNNVNDSCKIGAGKQFCVVSKLTTTVIKRVK